MSDWYLGLDWNDLFKDGELTQSKRKAAKDLMQDKDVLETMTFLDFIGLHSTQFENCWLVEFSLRDYEQYFHIKDRDEAYQDMKTRLDDAMTTWDDGKENGVSTFCFYLIGGYDYANGIIRVEVTEKGKEVIEKLRDIENEK